MRQPSSALSVSFDQRDTCDIFTLDDAIPHLDAYLSSIIIQDDDPGFIISWDFENLIAFAAAANTQNPVDAPEWMQTRPPNITADSFADDLVDALDQVAGGRCGRVLLAPNNLQQYSCIISKLCDLQNHHFIQTVGRIALPVVNNTHRYLATTYNLTQPKAQKSMPNNIPQLHRDDKPMHYLFI